MTIRTALGLLLAVVILTSVGTPAPRAEIASKSEAVPRKANETGLVERTGVALILLEVEAVDRGGRPLRGLVRDDFMVHLNNRQRPIATFDDLCHAGEADGQEGDAITTAGTDATEGTGAEAHADTDAEPQTDVAGTEFVLYLDFSQLNLAARQQALDAAGKWVRETMPAASRARVVACAAGRGYRLVVRPTGEKKEILEGLERLRVDPAYIDDFPSGLESRVDDCKRHRETCFAHAMEEFAHGRQSLTALRTFLAGLGDEPGHKEILYFEENAMLVPGNLYGVPRDSNEFALVETIAAEATSSRATVNVVRTGWMSFGLLPALRRVFDDLALDLSSALSEGTGGAYNRGPSDVGTVLTGAARSARCLYLLGIEPPEKREGRIYTASVRIRGRPIRALYRVQLLDEADRWMRRARAVLADPTVATDLEIGAAFLPIKTKGRRWEVSVETAIDADVLARLPRAGGLEGMGEVGALVTRDGGGAWEMAGRFEVRRTGAGAGTRAMVHRRLLADLRPGAYRLAAFARDGTTSLFGGAEASLNLPDPRTGGIAGPVLLRAERPRVVSVLPLLHGSEEAAITSRPEVGPLPLGRLPVRTGDALDVLTWVCPGAHETWTSPRRYLAREGAPVFRFAAPSIVDAGDCRRIADRVPTSELAPGHYTYHLRVERKESPPLESEASFEVTE